MTKLSIRDYDQLVANVELVDGKIVVRPVGDGNAWVIELVEGMRRRVMPHGVVTLSDSELYHSLRERMAGSLWAGEPRATPLPSGPTVPGKGATREEWMR